MNGGNIMVKRIGVLTSGGDAPGMNAAIRAVTRVALNSGIEVFGIHNGYKGLVEGNIEPLTKAGVGDIIDRGGTILGSARLPEFKDMEVRQKAVDQLKKEGLKQLLLLVEMDHIVGHWLLQKWELTVLDFLVLLIMILQVQILPLDLIQHYQLLWKQSTSYVILLVLIIVVLLSKLWETVVEILLFMQELHVEQKLL